MTSTFGYRVKISKSIQLQADNLCFNITEKGKMIVPDWYNKILDYTRKYCGNSVF